MNAILRTETRPYWDAAIETLPRERLEALQLERLRHHLGFAYDRSPYYRDAFDVAGVHPQEFRSLDDLCAFPFIDK